MALQQFWSHVPTLDKYQAQTHGATATLVPKELPFEWQGGALCKGDQSAKCAHMMWNHSSRP
eukprot:3539732-Amphidinium_carterae.1